MNLRDIIPNDPLLEDMSRRGFLKGLGAAAGMAATGASAAPFSHGEYKDQMTGKSDGKYSKVRSDDGRATLTLDWPVGGRGQLIVSIPGTTINFGARGAAGRIKIGSGPVQDVWLNQGQTGSYSWAGILNNSLISKILSHSGEVKIEVPFYRTGPEIFKFTIEQDNITKSMPKPDVKKSGAASDDSQNKDSKPVSAPSVGYQGRIKARIIPNFVYPESSKMLEESGIIKVQINVNQDGTIESRNIVQSSGYKRLDEAVLSAIDKTSVLPKDVDGNAKSVEIEFKASISQGLQ
jgi:TonB family protein